MKIYQPMLFVGLGGTGCRVGGELERRLREELCGPDGMRLLGLMQGKNFLPYQLPQCVQFVYADLSEDEFGRLEQRVVPDPMYLPAAERTMHRVTDLIPQLDTYPEVARSLRMSAKTYVDGWLPPAQGEPRIGPLARGAGQLPTVGRAALFETFRGGLAPVQDSLLKAIGEINNSSGELRLLGGEQSDSCDVFVAFSVAGGTGGGMFYDYLHLIGDALARENRRARIFPLVLMPSAFEDGLGGGRSARLNAGRALLDLFRLVDDQNAQAAGTDLDRQGIHGTLAVSYPGREEIRLRASTVQTAFLFSRGAGVRRDDLHRSVVSLVLTMIGTEFGVSSDGTRSTNYMSFADSFINSAVERELPAITGIGNRGVSTSSVASMTIPVDDLADIASSRMLAEAVKELSEPPPGRAENNVDLIDRFFTDANLDPLRLRAPLTITEPRPVRGAPAILGALNTRARTMESRLTTLSQQLVQEVPVLAERFDTEKACRLLLANADIFQLRRVVLGHPQLAGQVNQLGFKKIVELRQSEPPPPEGLALTAPAPANIRNRWIFIKAKWADKEVRESLGRQDKWYDWRAKREWHEAWRDQSGRWEIKLRALERQVNALTGAFLDHARADGARFTTRSKELFEARVGVSYLLPRQGELDGFYRSVVRRFIDVYVVEKGLAPTATVGDVVTEALRDNGWRDAYETSIDNRRGPESAVAHVRDQLKAEVKRIFAHSDIERRPLLPALGDLLETAAGRASESVDEDDVVQFREKLAGLVPVGFAPGGTGRLKILFSYPSSTRDEQLENFLRQEVYLPKGVDTIVDFRPIAAESIAVVMFRSSMGLTEVPEVREVLRHWSDALRNERAEDFLRWRQRSGYQFGYLATTAEHRVKILHHLLSAVWNGQVSATPDLADPESVQVHLNGSGVSMRLKLDAYRDLSGWADVLKAYEDWVLADDEQVRRDFCAQLITTLPNNLTGRPDAPKPLFQQLVELRDKEAEKAERMLDRPSEAGRRRLMSILEFWNETFPAALSMPFHGVDAPVEESLADLYASFRAQP
ncbi:MAG: tubulin-like doman-containing protein [Pseudonocardiaceae bacterium]